MQIKRVVGLSVGIIGLVVLLGPGKLLSAEPKRVPDASDAAKTAAQELQALPPGIIQVDCRPGRPTFPPFTRPYVVPGTGFGFHVLADGRCFFDPSATEPPSSGVFVVPIPSADPSAFTAMNQRPGTLSRTLASQGVEGRVDVGHGGRP